MNITVLELSDDKIRLVISGQGHTFMNALTSELLNDENVDLASYVIEFQFSDPELTVTTLNNAEPLQVIRDACSRLSNQCEELLEGLATK